MSWWLWLIIALVVVVVLALVAWWFWRRRRRERLRARFGPEYDRAVEETGRTSRAERELEERERRRAELDIRPLAPASRDRYAESWRQVQERFVDAPAPAVAEADRLVANVMRERGYPVDDFERRAADVSVDHPELVGNYRAAHDIYLKEMRGKATTEELRQAMVHYRSLFDELLVTEETTGRTAPATRDEDASRREVTTGDPSAAHAETRGRTSEEEGRRGEVARPVVREEEVARSRPGGGGEREERPGARKEPR
jgi:hypothetical protein